MTKTFEWVILLSVKFLSIGATCVKAGSSLHKQPQPNTTTMITNNAIQSRYEQMAERTDEIAEILVSAMKAENDFKSLDGQARLMSYYLAIDVVHYIRLGGGLPKQLGGQHVSIQS